MLAIKPDDHSPGVNFLLQYSLFQYYTTHIYAEAANLPSSLRIIQIWTLS